MWCTSQPYISVTSMCTWQAFPATSRMPEAMRRHRNPRVYTHDPSAVHAAAACNDPHHALTCRRLLPLTPQQLYSHPIGPLSTAHAHLTQGYFCFPLLRLRMYSSYSSSSSAMGRPIVMCFPSPFRLGMSLEDVLLTYPAANQALICKECIQLRYAPLRGLVCIPCSQGASCIARASRLGHQKSLT